MHIVITGGAGFLGQKLARYLITSALPLDSLQLVDIVEPVIPIRDPRVSVTYTDLREAGSLASVITPDIDCIFHLAAVVSSHAEKDFDAGLSVNLDMTRQLLEHCRRTNPDVRFIFASSVAVFGGHIPNLSLIHI